MDDWDTRVPGVSPEVFGAAYEAAEGAVLGSPGSAPRLDEALRPTLRIARAIARELTVDADELYVLSVRVCALWRLLAAEPAALRPLGIAFGEEGIRCAPDRREALLATAAAAPLSEDLRFDADGFLSALETRLG